MPIPLTMPADWHKDAGDGFHGKLTKDGPFKPERNRYHLYIGLFCPFAHRANLAMDMKSIKEHAGIDMSIVRPFPLGDDKGFPGWRFNVPEHLQREERNYPGATEDKLFGNEYMSDLYFRADPDYKGRYSVPVLWDKKLDTIVNNESAELLRDLQTAFDPLLPKEFQEINLYPAEMQGTIDHTSQWMHRDLNTGVYRAGFALDQNVYERNVPSVFAALNRLERLVASSSGPFVLGNRLTILDIQLYATLIRFDPVYVQHFMCNLGQIRREYPILHNWLKGLYHDATGKSAAFRGTTDFDHIKDNYMKSHPKNNPKAITPLGPWPHIEEGYEEDWGNITPGKISMPLVITRGEELYGAKDAAI